MNNDDIEREGPVDRTPWRKKSKYAIQNLPPTDDPTELKIRENMRKWEILNNKLIDSWGDYVGSRPATLSELDIVTKSLGGFLGGEAEVYNAETLEPIPSRRYPGKTMRYGEWNELLEDYERRSRRGIKGIIDAILDGLGSSNWS